MESFAFIKIEERKKEKKNKLFSSLHLTEAQKTDVEDKGWPNGGFVSEPGRYSGRHETHKPAFEPIDKNQIFSVFL